MENSDSLSISFSIYDSNLDMLYSDLNFPFKGKPALDISVNDYDLDNNKYLKKLRNNKLDSLSNFYINQEEDSCNDRVKKKYPKKKKSKEEASLSDFNHLGNNEKIYNYIHNNKLGIIKSLENNTIINEKLKSKIDNENIELKKEENTTTKNITKQENKINSEKGNTNNHIKSLQMNTNDYYINNDNKISEPNSVKLISSSHDTYLKEIKQYYINNDDHKNSKNKLINLLNFRIVDDLDKADIKNHIQFIIEEILDNVITYCRKKLIRNNENKSENLLMLKSNNSDSKKQTSLSQIKQDKNLFDEKRGGSEYSICNVNFEIMNSNFLNITQNKGKQNTIETNLISNEKRLENKLIPDKNLKINEEIERKKINSNQQFIKNNIQKSESTKNNSFLNDPNLLNGFPKPNNISSILNTNNLDPKQNCNQENRTDYLEEINSIQNNGILKFSAKENFCSVEKRNNKDNEVIIKTLLGDPISQIEKQGKKENRSIENTNDIKTEKGNEYLKKNMNENEFENKIIDQINENAKYKLLNTEIINHDEFENKNENEGIEKAFVELEEYRVLNKNHFLNINLNFDRKECDNIENIQICYKDRLEKEEINYSNNLNDFNDIILSKKETIKNQKYLHHMTRHFDKQSDINNGSIICDQITFKKLCDNDENMFSTIALDNCSDEVLTNSNNIIFEENSQINNLVLEEIQDTSSQFLRSFNDKSLIGNLFAKQGFGTTKGYIIRTDSLRERNDLKAVEEPLTAIENPYNSHLNLKNEIKANQSFIKDLKIVKNELKIVENDLNKEDICKHSNFPDSSLNNTHSFKIDNFNFFLGENKVQNNIQSSFSQQKRMKVIIENKINIDITKDSDKLNNHKSIINTKESLTDRKSSTEHFPNKEASTSKYKLTFINDKNNNLLTTNGFYSGRNKDYLNSPLSIYFSHKNYFPTNFRSNRIVGVNSTKVNLTKKPKFLYNPKKTDMKFEINEEKEMKYFNLDNEEDNSNKLSNFSLSKTFKNSFKNENFHQYYGQNQIKKPIEKSQQMKLHDNFSLNTNNTDKEESTTPKPRIMKSSSLIKKNTLKIFDKKQTCINNELDKKFLISNESLKTKDLKINNLFIGNMESKNSKPLKMSVNGQNQKRNIKKIIEINYPNIYGIKNRNPYI